MDFRDCRAKYLALALAPTLTERSRTRVGGNRGARPRPGRHRPGDAGPDPSYFLWHAAMVFLTVATANLTGAAPRVLTGLAVRLSRACGAVTRYECGLSCRSPRCDWLRTLDRAMALGMAALHSPFRPRGLLAITCVKAMLFGVWRGHT